MINIENLKKRFLETLFIIVAVALIIAFSQNNYVSKAVAAIVSLLGFIAICELSDFIKNKNIDLPKYFLASCVSLEILSFFIAQKFVLFASLPFFFAAIFALAIFLYYFSRIENAINGIATSIFSFFYISIPLGLMLTILYLPNLDGRFWIIYLLAVTKITDIGGYLGGNLFGKVCVTPRLSPKKTLTGFCAGLILAVAMSIFLGYILKDYLIITYKEMLILGSCIGLLAILGDLAESLLKRDAQIKDSGKYLGLGGMLDMLDSLIFTAPALYLYLQIKELI